MILNSAHHSFGNDSLIVRQNGTLTQQLVERGLSELGRTGDGTGVTFLTLTLKVSPNVYIC